MTERRTWLLTGMACGFSRALAEAIAGEGDDLVDCCRSLSVPSEPSSSSLSSDAFDVDDQSEGERVVRLAVDRFGGVNVIVDFDGHDVDLDGGEGADYGTNRILRSIVDAATPFLGRYGTGHIVRISEALRLESPDRPVHTIPVDRAGSFQRSFAGGMLSSEIHITYVEADGFHSGVTPHPMCTATVKPSDVRPPGTLPPSRTIAEGPTPKNLARAALAILRLVRDPSPPRRLVLMHGFRACVPSGPRTGS